MTRTAAVKKLRRMLPKERVGSETRTARRTRTRVVTKARDEGYVQKPSPMKGRAKRRIR